MTPGPERQRMVWVARGGPYSTTSPGTRTCTRASHSTVLDSRRKGIGPTLRWTTLGAAFSRGQQSRPHWARMGISCTDLPRRTPQFESWANDPIWMGSCIDAQPRLEGYAAGVGRPSPKPGYANARPLRQQPHSLWGCCGCLFPWSSRVSSRGFISWLFLGSCVILPVEICISFTLVMSLYLVHA